MSSHNKDPLEKQDTPSESSESHSDSDVDKAEENLVHLKIEERRKKALIDDSDESKPADSQTQEGTLKNEYESLNEPIAGPSGLQKSLVESSDGSSNAEPKIASLPDLKEADHEVEDIDEDFVEKMVEESLSGEKEAVAKDVVEKIMEDSDTTSSTPPFIQSSTGVPPLSRLREKSPVPGPSRPRVEYGKIGCREVAARFMCSWGSKSSSSRRYDYASDSANTSSDISEIRSEIADISTEGSVYHDAQENFEKEQSPGFVTAVERQSSEASDLSISGISELQEDFVPHPTPESSIVSASTPSEEQGHQAYLAQLQREADARGPPISTSSGIGSTDQSELAHLREWELAGEMGDYNRNEGNDPNRDVPDNVEQRGEPYPIPEVVEEEPISEGLRMQAFEAFERERQNRLYKEEASSSDNAMDQRIPRRVQERVQTGTVGVGSPSKRRRPSKGSTDKAEQRTPEKLRQKFKPDPTMKSKMVKSKSSPAKLSSSDSPEPKSSSSDEVHRKESPDIKTLSEESSKPGLGKKSWQKSGELRRMQHAAMSSKDSVIPEEEESSSDTREQNPEAKHPSPEKMDTDIEKSSEVGAESTEASGSIPSVVSSDQAYVSEAEGTLKDQSFEVSDFERSVGKSKREPKLSNSPPSDEKQDSSAAKAPGRPKKKPRPEKPAGKTRRTRHDSGGSVPKSVSLGNLPKEESTNTPDASDYQPSDGDEEDTSL